MCLQGLMQFHPCLFKIFWKYAHEKAIKPLRITPIVLVPSPSCLISSICLMHVKVFAKLDEIPSMILQDTKKTKCYGHTGGQSDGRTDTVKTVYPYTNTVCGGGGGYKNFHS